ncbi:MAG: hypothetical protein NTU49_09175 [Gammaproteobacteria bacterium]|nr:hypothetical protein [Gammaproteobacteria bacterium]
MRFFDTTEKKWQRLSIAELNPIVQEKTQRTLVFENEQLAQIYPQRFALIYFGGTIGFSIIALDDIPQGSRLFPYGGKNLSPTESEKNKNTAYLFTYRDESENPVHTQQAEDYGDLGSIANHLPSVDSLREAGFDDDDIKQIQTSNVSVELISNRLYYVASTPIKKGDLIGPDYGLEYWTEINVSPFLFAQKTLSPIDLTKMRFDGIATLIDERTDEVITTVSMETLCAQLDNCDAPFASIDNDVVTKDSFEEAKQKQFGANGRPKNLITFFKASKASEISASPLPSSCEKYTPN